MILSARIVHVGRRASGPQPTELSIANAIFATKTFYLMARRRLIRRLSNAGLTNSPCAMLKFQSSLVNSDDFCPSLPAVNRMSTLLDEAVLEERPEVDLSVLAALRAEPETAVVLAFDIGTSGVRAGLFNDRGDEIAGSQTSLTNEISDLTNGSDVNAGDLVEVVLSAIDLAVARAESFVSRIDYVAASCFWHSLMGVDNEGRATTPLFGWADTRAAEAVTELRSRFDEKQVHPRTGARFHPS